MTEEEKNAISSGVLVSPQMSELFMHEWLKMQNAELTGKPKMIWNNMVRSVQQAQYWHAQFTEYVATVLYSEDKDATRIDQMRKEASDMARIYLTSINLDANGYSMEAIIDAMNRLIEQEEKPKIVVSKEVIDQFKINL